MQPVEHNSYFNRIHPLALLLLVALGLFSLVFIGGTLVAFGKVGSTFLWKSQPSSAVGVIEITGPIFDSKKILYRLDKAAEDPQIKSVVLRLNSPGGAVAPSQEIYDAVVSFAKPLVVSMASVAASGAFYIACGAKTVFANPGTITGSIGVIMEFANLEGLYDFAKIHRYAIKTGKYKDAGAEYRALSEEERELFTEMAMNVLDQFKLAIEKGRHLTPEAVTQIADGRVFSGEQAKKLGLVDVLGGYNDALAEAGRLGNIAGKPQVVFVGKMRKPWMEWFSDDAYGQEESSFLGFFEKAAHTLHKTGLTRPTGVYFLAPGI